MFLLLSQVFPLLFVLSGTELRGVLLVLPRVMLEAVLCLSGLRLPDCHHRFQCSKEAHTSSPVFAMDKRVTVVAMEQGE